MLFIVCSISQKMLTVGIRCRCVSCPAWLGQSDYIYSRKALLSHCNWVKYAINTFMYVCTGMYICMYVYTLHIHTCIWRLHLLVFRCCIYMYLFKIQSLFEKWILCTTSPSPNSFSLFLFLLLFLPLFFSCACLFPFPSFTLLSLILSQWSCTLEDCQNIDA